MGEQDKDKIFEGDYWFIEEYQIINFHMIIFFIRLYKNFGFEIPKNIKKMEKIIF